MGPAVGVLVGVALLAMNAFFVAAEFALVSARRTSIEPRAAGGSRMARTTLRAMEQVSLVMAGAQLGITVCSLALGAVAEPAVAHLLEPVFAAVAIPEGALHPTAFVLALAVVVYLHVVVGEMVPKNITLADPERAALLLGPPMMVVVTVLRPVVAGLNGIANLVLRLIRVSPRDEVASAFTSREVAGMAEESRREGLLGEESYELLTSALGFTERTVSAVVLPEDSVTTVPRGAALAEVERLCAATGFSRFPVVAETGDLTGYIHVKDVLDTELERREEVTLDKWVHPLATVRPQTRLDDALGTLRARNAHLARVVEDDGTLVGIVALEDVIEELVGEIRDTAHRGHHDTASTGDTVDSPSRSGAV